MKALMQFKQTRKVSGLLIPLILAYFRASTEGARPSAPPPDGGYPGRNTAEGDESLLSLANSTDNTAVGYIGRFTVLQTGTDDTAIGSQALLNTTFGGGKHGHRC